MKIRLLKKKDIEKIMEIIKEWKKESSIISWDKRKKVEEVLRRSPKTCWVVEINKKIIGFRLVIDDIQNRAWARLTVISKKYRRKGIGSLLIREVDRKLKKMGFRKVYAQTSYKNIASINWHLKSGYRKVTLLRDWYKKGRHGILFIKNLD